jgi:hypothetical protein
LQLCQILFWLKLASATTGNEVDESLAEKDNVQNKRKGKIYIKLHYAVET